MLQQHEPPEDMGAVMTERRQLLNVAYRLLGSVADAEDVVQETYARWYALAPDRRDAVESPAAWLTRVAGRICLDILRSARVKRERYVGEWVPEPLPDRSEWAAGRGQHAAGDPADRITLDESVSMAFLVVLESMTPAERVAFVLHDVFGYPFPEVAEIVGRSPAACRQLASSARRRLRGTTMLPDPAAEQREVVRRFRQAWEARDIPALVRLLDPDVRAVADGGGRVSARLHPVRGSARLARGLVRIVSASPGLAIRERTVNGLPGLVVQEDGITGTVIAFDVSGGRIRRMWVVRNPDKLRPWTDPPDRPDVVAGDLDAAE